MEVARDSMKLIYDQLTQLQQIEGVELDEDAKPVLNFGLCAVVRIHVHIHNHILMSDTNVRINFTL
jgi:hypothetical protein